MDLKTKLEICESLAKGYSRAELRDDLIQEGLLAMLETESRGNKNPATMTMNAEKAMNDFISLKQSPLSIPASDKTRENAQQIRAGSTKPLLGMREETYRSLRIALGVEESADDYASSPSSVEDKVWFSQVCKLMEKRLSERDYTIFKLKFSDDELSDKEVSELLQVTETTVHGRIKVIKRKLAMLKKQTNFL